MGDLLVARATMRLGRGGPEAAKEPIRAAFCDQ